MLRRAINSSCIAISIACLASGTVAQERDVIPTLPLVLTIASNSGSPVVDDTWIETQVANANEIFAPHGAGFRVVARHTMGEEHARMETRRDRHSLGALMHPRAIDCFLVLSLRDVDDPSRYRQGVHWRPRGGYPEGSHFVILSSIAGPTVLAHELGHYFGNPHSDVPGNIMSYERGDVPPYFDAAQARRIRSRATEFLRSRSIVPADDYAP
jgi:hypothetical protein